MACGSASRQVGVARPARACEVEPFAHLPTAVPSARHRAWSADRTQFNADLAAKDEAALAPGWQRNYFHGAHPDGAPGPQDHCTRLRLRPFSES